MKRARAGGTKRLWAVLMVGCVGAALLTLPAPRTVSAGPALCNATAPVCGGTCLQNGTVCYGANQPNATSCSCVPSGCCRLNATVCQEDVAAGACGNSTFIVGGSCNAECAPPTETPTATASATPSATSTVTMTPTRAPNGDGCDDPADCISGNCVNDVCCDTACNGPEQACNIPGSVGTCSNIAAAAPAASHGALLAGVVLLLVVGGVALWRRRTAEV